jgi:hypothetical protein
LPNYEHVINVEDMPCLHEDMAAMEEAIKHFHAIKTVVKRAEPSKHKLAVPVGMGQVRQSPSKLQHGRHCLLLSAMNGQIHGAPKW